MLNDNSQFNADGAGNNDHQYGFMRAMAMSVLGLLPATAATKAADRRQAGVFGGSSAFPNVTPSDGVFIIVSVAGTVTFTFADASTLVATMAIGAYTLPFACTNVVAGTATIAASRLTF